MSIHKIIVIDDDPSDLQAVADCLGAAGYEVVALGDGQEALSIITGGVPDLVICDVQMPGLDGYAVLKALASDPASAHCPVLLVSEDPSFKERSRARRLGVAGYLTKPVHGPLLLRKLEGLGADSDSERHTAHGETRLTQLLESGESEPPALDASGLPDPYSIPALLRAALVVDDDPAFRRLLAHFLRSQAFTVSEAGDGEQAVAVALERRPWLILADLEMPGVDGLELCRRVRGHTLLRHTPFMFLSGWDDYKERYKGLAAGADDYLSKQTPLREIILRMHIILRRFSEIGAPTRTGAAMEGRLDLVGSPALLQICHVAGFTGTLAVRAGTRTLEVLFRDGDVVGATAEAYTGFDAIIELLSWERGYFEFLPGGTFEGATLGHSFDQLLLEACRRLDEQRRR